MCSKVIRRPEVLVLISFCLITSTNAYLAQLAARLLLNGTIAPPGTPWPEPAFSTVSETVFFAIGGRDSISYTSNLGNCTILNSAFARYTSTLFFRDLTVWPEPGYPVFSGIEVEIATDGENHCDAYPRLPTEDERSTYENYTLRVTLLEDEGSVASAKIYAWTVWGALRGLETFSQLVWQNGTDRFFVNETYIEDGPRYPHRGLMIDTARHYVDIPVIETILDAMSYNKLNVLHWHIVDDQSFPFVSTTYPELSAKGAYLPDLTYEPDEVQEVMDYAKDRGIRVILEFDTPGHTQVYGKSHLELLTPCYGDGENFPGTPNYPYHAAYEILDPTKDNTYDFMLELFREIKEISKDEYVHLGMDEVYYACWQSSPEIKRFMNESGYTNESEVLGHYIRRHVENVKGLGVKPIIWHDPLEFGAEVDNDNITLQVWKRFDNTSWEYYLHNALNNNFQVILSSPWYLNNISYGEAWRKYYEADPVLSLTEMGYEVTDNHKKLILGGEACIWAEFADPTNLIQRVFPFVGAVAERLWSPESDLCHNRTYDAMHRLDQHRCRLLWRGISAQPIFNGYCFPQEKSRRRNNGVSKPWM